MLVLFSSYFCVFFFFTRTRPLCATLCGTPNFCDTFASRPSVVLLLLLLDRINRNRSPLHATGRAGTLCCVFSKYFLQAFLAAARSLGVYPALLRSALGRLFTLRTTPPLLRHNEPALHHLISLARPVRRVEDGEQKGGTRHATTRDDAPKLSPSSGLRGLNNTETGVMAATEMTREMRTLAMEAARRRRDGTIPLALSRSRNARHGSAPPQRPNPANRKSG